MEQFRITPSSSLWTLAWPPHYKDLCLFDRPARRHSLMRVQLMASVRHAIDSRDASLLPIPYGHVRAYNLMTWRPSRLYYLCIVPLRVALLLVLLWAFLRLRRTHGALRVSKERRFLRRWSGSRPFHRARSGH